MLKAAVQMKGFPLAEILTNLKGSAAVPLTNVNPENLKKPEAADSSLLGNVSPESLIKPNAARGSLLSIVMVQDLVKLSHYLTKPDILSAENLAEWLLKTDSENLPKLNIGSVETLTNADIASAEMMTNDDMFTLYEDKNGPSSQEFSDSIKKIVATSTRREIFSPVRTRKEGFFGIGTRGGNHTTGGSFRRSTRAGMVWGDEVGDALGAARVAQQADQFSAASDLAVRRCNSVRATLTNCWISSPAFVPISSMRASASSDESSRLSSLPASWRRVISFLAAATRKPAVDSPLVFIASIPSITSCGIRIEICLDLSLLVFAAMRGPVCCVCDSVYTKKNHIKLLLCDSLCYNLNHTLSTDSKQVRHRNSEARRCDNTDGPLTTSVSISNEVAMSDHITPICGRDLLTPKKYQYRFLALSRVDAAARPCRVSIMAATEQEARRVLAPLFILSLAARLPVQEVAA